MPESFSPIPTDQTVESAFHAPSPAVGGTAPGAPNVSQLDELSALCGQWDQAAANESLPYRLPDTFLVSVVIPVYNEESTVRELIRRVCELPLPLQIIIVDDCSTDGTRDVLQALADHPHIEVIFKPTNEGKGAALRTGFSRASGNVIVVQDADLEYDPRDIPRLLEPIVNGDADIVYGSRFLERDSLGTSRLHRLGNQLLTFASNATTGLQITDMETCYKVFRRDVLDDMSLRQNRFGFEPEFTAKIARRGYLLSELPIRYQARHWRDGKKIGVRDALSAAFCIVRYAAAD